MFIIFYHHWGQGEKGKEVQVSGGSLESSDILEFINQPLTNSSSRISEDQGPTCSTRTTTLVVKMDREKGYKVDLNE